MAQKLASVFANVDKSQVPTGYLYEAGLRFLELRNYRGVLTDSSVTDQSVLRYLRLQLASSRVAGPDTLPQVRAYNARLEAALASANGAILLTAQYMQYASIRPDALQQNLLRGQNEQLFDVAGRAQSPYQTQVLFAAAPALPYSRTGTVSFVFAATCSSPMASTPRASSSTLATAMATRPPPGTSPWALPTPPPAPGA